jgi:hypothetical protein
MLDEPSSAIFASGRRNSFELERICFACTPVLRAFAERFLAACKATPFKLAWIATTRGENCAAWYAEHVMPKLV